MENVKELLKQKFPGIRPDVLAQLVSMISLVATTEEEQKAMVEKLDKAQVEAFGTDYRKTVDAEVSKGVKTNEENLKKKYDFVEKGKKNDPEPPTPAPTPKEENSDEEKYEKRFASMQKTIETLNGTIAAMQKENVNKDRGIRYGEILKDCKDDTLKAILERQLPLLQSLSDDDFNVQLETLKGDVEKSNQLYAERSLPTPTFTKSQPSIQDTATKAETDAMVKKLKL